MDICVFSVFFSSLLHKNLPHATNHRKRGIKSQYSLPHNHDFFQNQCIREKKTSLERTFLRDKWGYCYSVCHIMLPEAFTYTRLTYFNQYHVGLSNSEKTFCLFMCFIPVLNPLSWRGHFWDKFGNLQKMVLFWKIAR